jgi:hypothetical protein
MKVWVGVVGGDYISLDIVDGFALHGQVVGDYPAATRIVDQEVRLEIELDSVDKTLDDELSLDHAVRFTRSTCASTATAGRPRMARERG